MSELATTPLNRITVSRLSAMTGISRQGFYYHFSDVYDLAVWNFKTQVTERVKAYATYSSWVTCIEQMLVWLQEHKTECYRVIEAMPSGELEQFLYTELHELMVSVMTDLEAQVAGEHLRVSTYDRDFIIEHTTLTVQAHIMHWLSHDMPQDPHFLIPRVEKIMHGSVARGLRIFAAEPTPEPGSTAALLEDSAQL